jgi:hypothetical protein
MQIPASDFGSEANARLPSIGYGQDSRTDPGAQTAGFVKALDGRFETEAPQPSAEVHDSVLIWLMP